VKTMKKNLLRRSAILAAVAGLVAGASLTMATAASASVPTPVAKVTWNVRTSWVNYLTNPVWYLGLGQGSVTRTASNGGTSTVAAGSATTSWGALYTNYAYSYDFATASDSGSPRTVVLKGGLDFDLGAHGIDISLSDLTVVENPSGDESLTVDASYVALGASSPTTLSDAPAFTIADTASGDGTYAVTLTATGAQIFNGGSNGSYAAGDAFGSVSFG